MHSEAMRRNTPVCHRHCRNAIMASPVELKKKKKERKRKHRKTQNNLILNSKSLAADQHSGVRLMCMMLLTIITAVYRVKLLLGPL